jgi:Caspase domain
MRPAALRIALLALLIGVLAPTMAAHAQARLALVVGNNAYESVPKLERATNDSREVARALQAMGFEVMLATDVNRRTLVQRLDEFNRRIQKGVPCQVVHGNQVPKPRW